jgi:fumarate hydratase, class II
MLPRRAARCRPAAAEAVIAARGRAVEHSSRTEHDSLGPVEVPADRLWGAQTQRAIDNFRISSERWAPELLVELARIKRAAAVVNGALGLVPRDVAQAIAAAAQEVIERRHDDEFPLVVWQTGSGTQTNMNMNEVLANRASELLGGPRGTDRRVHPNDHVNRCQSSNDVIPTAIHVATAIGLRDRVSPALESAVGALHDRQRDFASLVKIGRTHLQDAVPMTLGQEFSAFAAQLARVLRLLPPAVEELLALPIGGTAVGTGLNAHPEFGWRVARELAASTGLGFAAAQNRFELIASHDALVAAHAVLNGAAVALNKIANDLRWLASGPDAGLGEIALPANEPGSSIMPGKVNPTQVEALTMACLQVMGNHSTLTVAASSGMLQLNVYKPLIGHLAMQSIRLLADATESFNVNCIAGITANQRQLATNVAHSRMLVTALAPHIGYDRAAQIVHHAVRTGATLRDAALAQGVAAADFDRWVDPQAMAGR